LTVSPGGTLDRRTKLRTKKEAPPERVERHQVLLSSRRVTRFEDLQKNKISSDL
jgi:hypothetical protein